MKILDATCGFRGIWYQKHHPFVTFMDKRKGTFHFTDNAPKTKLKNRRSYNVLPDVVSEWKDAPFPDDYFDMVIFDPPHMIRDKDGSKSAMMIPYGSLDKQTYKEDIKLGVEKLFRILKPEGVFILKWCENAIPVEDIFALMPYKPLFGSNTKKKSAHQNYWVLFLKHRVEDIDRFK